MHPFSRLLFTSQGYMQYKMLAKNKLMGKQEAMMYLRNFGITSSDVALVSPISLTGVEVNIAAKVAEDENVE